MSGSNVVDARGLSCPEPVLMAQNALKEYGLAAFSVEVSSASARDNVEKFLKEKGRTVRVESSAGGWRIEAGAG
ncbi:MAG: sulfurtransferase TusA family protein [Treponema sp.]|nr:sulfurtransferase TusA family protein [Treponema sp.]